uniref:Neuromedin U n=1 Tax=Leptobrachium leishanense TaxID=445787 RepID=A0A8C5LXY0_9ANUR
MHSPNLCQQKPPALPNGPDVRSHGKDHQLHRFRRHPPCGLLLLLMLSSWTLTCQGVPFSSRTLQAEQELQIWNEIEEACTAILSDPQPLASSALEELCLMAMGILQRSQGSEERDITKRSSVAHPLLQLDPQLHERRMKRFSADEDIQSPGGALSRGFFMFRPRNGRRSASFR